MLARVNHPNVVRIFGAEEHDGRIGLWMELIEGQTLEAWTQANGLMSVAEAAKVGRRLCAALAAVHGAGLTCRDINLRNVIRQESGEIRLTEFGSGMRADSHVPGRVSGTPFYLAPELFDDVPASARSDIYALGVLLYRLTTGSFPVEADSIDELQEALRLGHREVLDERPDLPASFNAAIEKAIAIDPDQRFASPAEFIEALGELRDRPAKSLRRRIGIFAMLGHQFTAPMVAAVLMILGYSINDTIVVFDRIREELELNPGSNLLRVMNIAINRTLARTLLTSVTTLLAAVSLFIFGAGVINECRMQSERSAE